MSILFYHNSIKRVERLIAEGDEEEIEEAQAILSQYIGVTTSHEIKEKKAFLTLLYYVNHFLSNMDHATLVLRSKKGDWRKDATDSIKEAKKYGKNIPKAAQEVARYALKEGDDSK